MPAAGVSVNVAGIKLSLGVLLDIKYPWMARANGSMTATAGFDATLDLNSAIQFGASFPNPEFTFNTPPPTVNLHPPTFNANIAVQAQSGLETRLRATFISEELLSASVAASGNLDMTVSANTVPFPAKKTGTGACLKPHFAEWGLDFFVNATGQYNLMKWGSSATSLLALTPFSRHVTVRALCPYAPMLTYFLFVDSPSKEYFRKPLGDGCLFPKN